MLSDIFSMFTPLNTGRSNLIKRIQSVYIFSLNLLLTTNVEYTTVTAGASDPSSRKILRARLRIS